MLVYRIEKDGIGPFRSFVENEKWNECYYNNPETHPAPDLDPLLKDFWGNVGRRDLEEYYFAFHSIDQLTEWFNVQDHLEALYEEGYEIYVFETNDVKIGKRQVIFKKEDAVFIETIQINTLFKNDLLLDQEELSYFYS